MIANTADSTIEKRSEDEFYSVDDLQRSAMDKLDKLKTIRPFSESDLLNLHENIFLQENNDFIDKFIEKTLHVNQRSTFFQLLTKLKERRESLRKCKEKLVNLRNDCVTDQEKVWKIVKKKITKRGRCADNKNVEAEHLHLESIYNNQIFNLLEKNLLNIQKTILDDYCLLLYNQEIVHLQFETALEEVLNIDDDVKRKSELELVISSLFAFQRDEQIVDDDFDKLVKEWMTKIFNYYYKDITTDGRLFLLNHVLRCPPASINWFGSFIDCANPLDANDHNDAIKSMNFCLAMISTILSPIKFRDKYIKYNQPAFSSLTKHKLSNVSNNSNDTSSTITFSNQKENSSDDDDVWHLLDSENERGEDIHLNESDLTELDIIQLLVQMPFEDLLKFLSEGLEHLQADEDYDGFRFGEQSELAILKLISVSTQIIQILRQGLLTFNCMKFKTLTDYITSMIEKTVNCVSTFWMKCKNQFYAQDQALILRIQVEYDHFILRSVVTILSCQKYGIWKFISVIPFDGITESMIWHIVWVFYNGRDEIDELSGLCGYFSESYWKSKFNEKSVGVLFKEKLPNLSINELENLIRSLGNMIKSRSNDDESEFVKTIAIDIFEISLFKPLTNEHLINLATNIFSDLVLKHPFIVTSLLEHIDNTKKINENCIKFFSRLTLSSWIPNDNMLKLINKWIYNQLLSSLLNQLARIVLSRLNYQKDKTEKRLFLNVDIQQRISLIIYNSIDEHLNNNENLEFSCSFVDCSYEQLIKLATTTSSKQFMEWSWRILLLLKLNPNDPLNKLDQTIQIPNIYTNNDYFLLRKGFDYRNLYSIYICLMMTDIGQKLDALESNLDLICHLMRNKIYVPALKIIEFFIPLHIRNLENISNHPKFNALFNQLLISEENYIYDRIVGLIRDQLNANKDKPEQSNNLISFWINFMCNQTTIIMKQNQNSWFINSNRGLHHVCYVLDQLILNVFRNEELRKTVIDLVSVKSSEMQALKIPQSNSLTSWLPLNNMNKKSDDWTTPLHCFYEKYNQNIYFSFILIKADYLKIEKLWEEILFQMAINTSQTIDQVLKNVCNNFNVSQLPYNFLPVNAWAKLAIDCPNDHPLMSLILFNFFVSFFSSSNNGGSLGLRTVSKVLLRNVKTKINQLTDIHSKQMMKSIANEQESPNDVKLSHLYKAFQLWIEDNHLHDAFVDLNHLPPDYMVDFLRTVFTNNTHIIDKYVDNKLIDNQIQKAYKWWLEVSYLKTDQVLIDDQEIIKKEQILKFSKIEKLEMPVYKEKNKRKELWIDFKNKEVDVIIDILKSKIECVMEETRLFDQKLDKLAMLNVNFLSALTELHKNVPKTMIIHTGCDQSDGCTGASQITLEFKEDKKDESKQQLINSNRLDYHYLLKELMQTPSKRVIDCAICLRTFLLRFQQETNRNSSKQLLSYFLTFLEDDEVITFAPAGNIFNLLIDSLNLNILFRDETTYYMMMTAIKYPKLTQYFATRLYPTDCSAESFLKMYSLIQQNLFKAPSHILFVMLSKFDLNGWLKKATNEQIQQMLNSLKEALNCLGQSPENDKLILLGLYRKHFQLILIYKFPENLISIFKIMLDGMSSFKFTPILWKDILLSFGLYLPPNQMPAQNLLMELKKYASIQPLFNASDIYSILKILNEHFGRLLLENPKIEFISRFQDYFHSFVPVLAALSFIWINANQHDLPNFNNIWLNCTELWYLWIFPKIEMNERTLVDLEYIWVIFISLIENYGSKFQPMYPTMLSFLFRRLAVEFQHFNDTNIKIFKLIQTKILQLNWKLFLPNQEEQKLMFSVVNNPKYRSEKFITKIMCSIDWKVLFDSTNPKDLPESSFYLAYILVKNSFKESDLNVNQIPFHCININDLNVLAKLIEQRVQVEEYLINQNESSKLMFMILEMSCFVNANQKRLLESCSASLESESDRQHFIFDLQQRRLEYSRAFCEILANSVKDNSSIYQKYPSELKMFFADFLYRIKIFDTDTLEQHRLEVLEAILPIINAMSLDEARKINLKTLLKNASIDKTYSLNLFAVCCEQISNVPDFLNICENSIINLANSNGKIEEISNLFNFDKQIPSDFILNCLNENAYLSMYLMFFKLKSDPKNSTQYLYNEIANYFLQLKLDANLEAKTFAIWYNLLIEIDELLKEENQDVLPFTMKLIRVLNALTEDVSSPKFLYFIKSTKKDVSFRSMFLCLSHAALLLVKAGQIIKEDHANYAESVSLLRQIIAKLQSFKKNKNFAEYSMLIEKLINLIESKVDLKELGIPVLKSWLLAYFSEENYFELMLKEYD